jgi:hypothetical protein
MATDPIIEQNLDRADYLLTAEELRVKYYAPEDRSGDEGAHPRFTQWDWIQAVAQRVTRRGYWDWVHAQIEEANEPWEG